VLLLTAGTIDREKGYAIGADDFIGKPIETVELRARGGRSSAWAGDSSLPSARRCPIQTRQEKKGPPA
jgi:hypothetical protein